MRIGGRKETVAHPHRQIRQGQLANRHNLVFAVIQFMHHALICGQILQGSQEFTLFTTLFFMLNTLLVAFLLDTRDVLPQRL